MGPAVAIGLVFASAAVAPLVQRWAGKLAGGLLALAPLSLFIYLATFIGPILAGETIERRVSWVPSLGVQFSVYIDGLSLLFGLLITGVGALIIFYTGGYLAGHRDLGRLYAILLLFLGSMLGLVLAGNLLLLFLFWELTSISSYLLIGFDHHREEARRAALQALLVTGAGGLAMLAGIVLLAFVGDSYELSALLNRGEFIRSHGLALPVMLLFLAGAFTKSAQVPFHFWLPNAMEAPTPVSAFLHSATMVKAGVYLMARISPIFAEMELWHYILPSVGMTTMVVASLMALGQTDLKRILAYTTVAKLGILTTLLGLGTEAAIKAAMIVLLAHALYKSALFLIAGIIDHETGTRDISRLSGLRRSMPIVAASGFLAAGSMAAVPPLLGFIGKEKLYEATLAGTPFPWLLVAAAVVTSALLVTAAWTTGVRPFLGREGHTPRHPHEAPLAMWIGPALLSGLGLLIGLAPGIVFAPYLSATVSGLLREPVTATLHLWSGFNLVLLLTLATLVAGMLVYLARDGLLLVGHPVRRLASRGPERLYELSHLGMLWLAGRQSQLLQSGYLRYYVIIVMLSAVALVGSTLLARGSLQWPLGATDLQIHEAGVAALIVVSAVAATLLRSRLAAAAALSTAGYGVALIFLFFGAPDLAMTQILIETLTVVLFVLVFYHLPPPLRLSRWHGRLRDAGVAAGVGILMSALVLVAAAVQFEPSISGSFVNQSVPLGHGRNVVNVILVDFRALDTLGEITVLAIAAIGIHAMLKARRREE